MNTKYLILSHFLDDDTPSYGNRDNISIYAKSQINKGDSANSSHWDFSINHIGTHIDFPSHFYGDGSSLTDFSASDFIFTHPQLIDVPCERAKLIEFDELKTEIEKDTDILLLRTGYEKYRKSSKYWNDNPGLSAHCGSVLHSEFQNIRAVGFDFISLTSWKYRVEGKKAHLKFLDETEVNKFVIVEDMALDKIGLSNIRQIILAPIMIKGTNGAPVTIFCELSNE